MKKIGILYGRERAFPDALIKKINSKKVKGVHAEPVYIEKVIQGEDSGYAMIIDRISHVVPFYRSYLKNAALCGTAVVNNPFWKSADEKFFDNSLAAKMNVAVPKTVILPSRDLPADTSHESFINLSYPLDWGSIFHYIGFPAYMKPFAGGGRKHIYRVKNIDDFYNKHGQTGERVMMLQEEIAYEEFYRCCCIGGKYVRVMSHDPRNPHLLRYAADFKPSAKKVKELTALTIRINQYLGYDINTVDFAVKAGVPYVIDFCNPVPEADIAVTGEDNFNWLLETSAAFAIERTLSCKEGEDNLTWGDFLRSSILKKKLK